MGKDHTTERSTGTKRLCGSSSGKPTARLKKLISGLWALQYLIDQAVVDQSLVREMYTTFLASTFRSIRFGIKEAHSRGVAIQLNTFLDQGAVHVADDGTFSVVHEAMPRTVEALTRKLMTIQAEGNYE